MRNFLGIIGLIAVGAVSVIAYIIAMIFTFGLTILMMAMPFISIGIGLGVAGWTFCFFVSFC